VAGTTPGNGTDDSFGTGTFSHNVDVGVSDLEPGAFGAVTIGATKAWAGGGNNDPVGTYSAAFTGPDQGVAALQAMTHATVFQQVFGFVVSTNLGITSLPKEQIAGIYDALVTDWVNVATGATASATVTAVSTPIVICNRELGSGTRAETDVFLNGDGCNGVGTVSPLISVAGAVFGTVTEPADNFQTAAELDCVNRSPNAIGYVSIDNFSKLQGTTVAPNVNAIAVSGAVASQLNGATGVYSDVFEASVNENASASADGKTWYTDLVPVLQAVNTTPKSGQVLAIPGQPAGNTASIPLQVGSPSTEFTSLFNRGGGAGNSCTPLTPQL
jgi:ABC-type phosphate transport system substrate-binding protein